MATWLRYLVPALLAASMLTAPVFAVVPPSESCHFAEVQGACTKYTQDQDAVGAACTDIETPCCQRSDSAPADGHHQPGCGSCPLGHCDCCQSAPGLTLNCLPVGEYVTAPNPIAVPLLTVDPLLISRSDEPLLPPPIA